jgi:hypothetical protein
MADTKKLIASPAFLAASATNIYTPPASTIISVITHIHISNVTGGAVTFTLYVGATGGSSAGTELFKAKSVAANDTYDWYSPGLVLKSTEFLTGLASAGSSLTITVMGTQFVTP